MLLDEFFRSDCQWAKSAVYELLTTVANRTLERTEKRWVSWDGYVAIEGQAVADKQKTLKLLVDRRCQQGVVA